MDRGDDMKKIKVLFTIEISRAGDEADTLIFLRRHVGEKFVGKRGVFTITEVKKYEGKD